MATGKLKYFQYIPYNPTVIFPDLTRLENYWFQTQHFGKPELDYGNFVYSGGYITLDAVGNDLATNSINKIKSGYVIDSFNICSPLDLLIGGDDYYGEDGISALQHLYLFTNETNPYGNVKIGGSILASGIIELIPTTLPGDPNKIKSYYYDTDPESATYVNLSQPLHVIGVGRGGIEEDIPYVLVQTSSFLVNHNLTASEDIMAGGYIDGGLHSENYNGVLQPQDNRLQDAMEILANHTHDGLGGNTLVSGLTFSYITYSGLTFYADLFSFSDVSDYMFTFDGKLSAISKNGGTTLGSWILESAIFYDSGTFYLKNGSSNALYIDSNYEAEMVVSGNAVQLKITGDPTYATAWEGYFEYVKVTI